jgi:hypothetical protein
MNNNDLLNIWVNPNNEAALSFLKRAQKTGLSPNELLIAYRLPSDTTPLQTLKRALSKFH